MKRLHTSLLSGLLLLAATTLAVAQETDFSGYRIFINPGHGGHDSDDRHMTATDFWESDGNLEKGLFLKSLLEKNQATVFISRTTNTTVDDLDFSVIDEMANSANVDVFLSIHSNGGNGQLNRPLMLFRGYDNQPQYPVAKELAGILWDKVFENATCWTMTGKYVKGDWSFYTDWGKQGLGVLRNLAAPGVLSEGSFHDFLPESWRLRNQDFLHHEAWAFYRAFEAYFNISPATEGIAAGIVRDSCQKAGWKSPRGSKDLLCPVNDAMVTLVPGNRTYQIDHLNNGFYYFDSIPPGNYTLYVDGPQDQGYARDSAVIVIEPDRTTLTDFRLKKNQ
ncbi:MAG: N-acetylmuramoyl-L-alanine amidase [Bacteroidota bacterium]|nr:N-acetylmuramoyl-L-alanine amidase [Bacteroidota bacterium]